MKSILSCRYETNDTWNVNNFKNLDQRNFFFFSSKTIFFIFRWSIFFRQAHISGILIAPIGAISNMMSQSQEQKKIKISRVHSDHLLRWLGLIYNGKWLENELIKTFFTIFEFGMLKSWFLIQFFDLQYHYFYIEICNPRRLAWIHISEVKIWKWKIMISTHKTQKFQKSYKIFF